jgi:hypothetical protein
VIYIGADLPPFRRRCTPYYQGSTITRGVRGGAVSWSYKPEGRGFDSDCVTGIFH